MEYLVSQSVTSDKVSLFSIKKKKHEKLNNDILIFKFMIEDLNIKPINVNCTALGIYAPFFLLKLLVYHEINF